MQWFKVQYNVDERRRVIEVLQQFRRALRNRVGVKALYEDLLKQGAIPSFFEQVFEQRGTGGAFYGGGRTWKELTPAWLEEKRKHGWDSRIGHRLGQLRESLTQPGSEFNITQVTEKRAVFGSSAADGGKTYAGYFNAVRPVIDPQAMQDIRAYLTAGGGSTAFERAVAKYKLAVAWKAVSGTRHNRFGNAFLQ